MKLPTQMQALVLRGSGFGNLAVETVPVPQPGPRQALVRVDAAGICTSLIKLIAQGSDHSLVHGWDLATFPVILGDEGSVTVVALGSDLQNQYEIGSRFVVQPAVDSRPINFRERYRNGGAGIQKVACGHTLPGHLAQYMLLPEEIFAASCLVPIRDPRLPYAHAAISEPISCCVSGQFHHMHLEQSALTDPRSTTNGLLKTGVTLVVGLGAMGRMHIDVALAQSPRLIIGSDPMESRRSQTKSIFEQRAKAAGVSLDLVTPDTVAETIAKATNGNGVDDLIIAVGHGRVIEESLNYLGRGGCANVFAGLRKGEELVQIDANRVHYQEVSITGSSGGTAWDIAQTLDWMSKGQIDASKHIAVIGGLDHVIDLIHEVKDQKLEGKAVLYPHAAIEHPLRVPNWSAADEMAFLADRAGGNRT